MKISPNTKISALIKANPKAIDVIASINSHFEKLRNPLLRKFLAGRVTIAEAARIGRTDVAVFFDKLSEIGFEPEGASSQTTDTVPERKEAPNDLPEKSVELDVRDALQTGNDPFLEIMEALEKLPAGHALKLVNTFEPTPLISILKKRGYSHFTDQLTPDLIHTYFYKTGITQTELTSSGIEKSEAIPEDKMPAKPSFTDLLNLYEGCLRKIDVRQLEMPMPMVTILQTLPTLEKEEALFVYHKRVPQFLLPQLSERGMAYAMEEAGPDQVHMLIYKDETGGNHK